MLQSVRETLASKLPALLTISADKTWRVLEPDGRPGADFSASYWTNLSSIFMHFVTAVDFVNRMGRKGSMTPEELKREVETSPGFLDYILVKNSWGTKLAGENDPPGYFRLSREFLLANSFVRSPPLFPPFRALVLKKYVDLPKE